MKEIHRKIEINAPAEGHARFVQQEGSKGFLVVLLWKMPDGDISRGF